MMKLVATTVVLFLVAMSMQLAHHEAEGRLLVMNMEEQALLLGLSLGKGVGKAPAKNPLIPGASTINQRVFAGHSTGVAPPAEGRVLAKNMEEQALLLGSSLGKGVGKTPAPNPPTHGASTINQRGFAGHNAGVAPPAEGGVRVMNMEEQAHLLGSSLPKHDGKTPAPNPPTHGASTINQRGFAGHNAGVASPAEGRVRAKNKEEQALLLGSSLGKGDGKTPAPNPATHGASTINQRGFAGHNAGVAPPAEERVRVINMEEQARLLGSSLPKHDGKTPAPNPATHGASTINQRGFAGHNAGVAPPAEERVRVRNMEEQARLLGSSLPKHDGKTPAPNPPTHGASTVNRRTFASHNASVAPPLHPRPSAHSTTMQLLFAMAAATNVGRK